MSVEIVYYNTQPSEWLESKLAVLGDVHTAAGEDRRGFLTALANAVGVSNITICVGQIAVLSTVLAKGLGMPPQPVDWAGLGISGDESVLLPSGALPLISNDCVYGMILENANQSIIAIESEPEAMQFIVESYVLPYISALSEATPVEIEAEPDTTEPEAPQEAKQAQEQPPVQDVDIFADIEDNGFLDIEPSKKKRGVLIAFICILLVIAIAAAGGYVGYKKWWLPKQSEDALAQAKSAYTTQLNDVSGITMPADYSLKFAALYEQNNDTIGWLKVSGLGIDTPIVTDAMHSADYYDTHLFNGKSNPYGTPYIKYGYDTAVNINPNLVIYGTNLGDGRGFSRLEELLTADGLKKVKSFTFDSVLYGHESRNIISVMLLDKNSKEYDYADNFRQLDEAKRSAAVMDAVSLSRVATGYSATDFEKVALTDSFVTLVTPYSKDDSKVIVVMACSERTEVPIEEELTQQPEETESQSPTDTSSENISSEQ